MFVNKSGLRLAMDSQNNKNTYCGKDQEQYYSKHKLFFTFCRLHSITLKGTIDV